MNRSKRVAFATLGCKVNQSETDLLARQFAAAGYECVASDQPADIYVLNTCTVTHVADRKSRQTLSQARRANPDALIVATGCFASIAGEALNGPGTLVVRNRDKDRLVALVQARLGIAATEANAYVDLEKYLNLPGPQVRSRPMVKAQDGCDSHCAYCIIPRSRGRSRSIAPEMVIRRIDTLARQGHAEAVVTGVDLGSYGEDADEYPDLGGLLRRILAETEIKRLRVSSLEPGDFKEKWLELWEDPRLCRHLHVPLQAGSARVLERMGRKYSPIQFAAMVQTCRQVDGMTVTTDVMVGFPGETDSEFDEGHHFIRSIGFDGMHVFKYSARSGTPAARMPDQVSEETKARRSEILRQEGAAGAQRLLARHEAQTAWVVWESTAGGVSRGMTDTNVRVYAAETEGAAGMSRLRLTTRFRDGLWGEPPNPVLSPANR